MTRPILVDLFCGAGGAAAGYYEAGFRIIGVDNKPQPNYPFAFYQGDALDFVARYGRDAGAYHASPPCQPYSRGTVALPDREARYDRLIAATRAALVATGRPYILENVQGAYSELVRPVMLCGRMFGLSATDTDGTPLVLDRHRLFESNVALTVPPHPPHDRRLQVAGAYGGARRDKREAREIRHGGYVPRSVDVQRALLGTQWMTEAECWQAIPPSYTAALGPQLIATLTG
jgi:DNA (cytosine-5)-methyltransferase 1